MRTSLDELWGCGRGPIRHAAPPIRLVAGATVFAACMVATVSTLGGSLCVGVSGATWVAVCGPPWRVLRNALLLGFSLFLPYFLLLPLLTDAPAESWRDALIVPWTILLRGLGGMIIGVATVTALPETDLREALHRLPVPGMVSAILLQIIHQTSTLLGETRRVAEAMALRGASSGGVAAWRVLFSLPQVWLPRVLERAERVAAAMELRGYSDAPFRSAHSTSLGLADLGVLGLAAVVLGLAISLRVLGAQ